MFTLTRHMKSPYRVGDEVDILHLNLLTGPVNGIVVAFDAATFNPELEPYILVAAKPIEGEVGKDEYIVGTPQFSGKFEGYLSTIVQYPGYWLFWCCNTNIQLVSLLDRLVNELRREL